MLRFLNNILILILVSSAAMGQTKDSSAVRSRYLPTGIRVGTDLISIIRSRTDNSFSGYEFTADVDFYRYFLTMDVGRWERRFSAQEDVYTNNGNYARIGADVNFLLKDTDRNMFFIGARYGWGTYSEKLSVLTVDPVWGANTTVYSNSNVKASWFELTSGLRVKIWKYFWMGYTARYKFSLNTNTPRGFISHDVPGYGKTANPSTWGFNYQLFFKIPMRKQK